MKGGLPGEILDNGARPPGEIDLSSTTQSVPELLQDAGSTYAPGSATHSITLHRAASGALPSTWRAPATSFARARSSSPGGSRSRTSSSPASPPKTSSPIASSIAGTSSW